MYKSILVHVDPYDAGTASRIEVAKHLAEQWQATLIGMVAALPAATVALLASGGAAIAAGVLTGDSNELDEHFATARSAFARGTQGASVQTIWRTAIDFPAQAIASTAARADLLVVGQARHSSAANGYLDYGDLVMRAGRPVLAVPPGLQRLDPRAVVVAWRDTRESRRALADALPLLSTADTVTLLHVRENGDDGEEKTSIADARAFLDGHGISAACEEIAGAGQPAARAIVDFATRTLAGVIVAGAYGHSRVREWVFGGVTRDLMAGCPIPCLLSR